MRTTIVAAAVVALAAAGGAAYYGLEVYPQREFRAGLDQALTTLPPGTTLTYKDAHYAPVTGVATLTGVAVHGTIPGDKPQPYDVTADSLETTRANLDFANAWTRALANPAAIAAEASLPVADNITIKGLTVRSGAINISEESTSIAKVRLYPWALLHKNMPRWAEIKAAMEHDPSSHDFASLLPVLRMEAAVMLGVGYDSHEAGAAKGTHSLPGQEISYAIRKVSGGAFDRGVLAGGTAEGITVTGAKAGTIGIDRVAVGASDYREPLTRILNGEPLTQSLLNGIKIGRIEYAGISAQPPGMAAIRVGEVSLGPASFSKGALIGLEFGGKDIAVSRDQIPDADAKKMFDQLGLKTLTVSFSIAYAHDPAKQASTNRDTIKVNELGTLTHALDVTGIGSDFTPAALAQARLAHATLRLDDASLTERLLKLGAAQTGADPAAFRQQVNGIVLAQSAALGSGSPAILAAGKAVSAFIASPKSLTIELAPPAPVGIMGLWSKADDPGALATAVGLTATANQ